jgi:hypothetical protein
MLPLDRSNTAGPCIYISSLRAYYVRTRVQISRAVLTTEIDRWWLFQLPYRSMCWDADRSVRWIKSESDRSVGYLRRFCGWVRVELESAPHRAPLVLCFLPFSCLPRNLPPPRPRLLLISGVPTQAKPGNPIICRRDISQRMHCRRPCSIPAPTHSTAPPPPRLLNPRLDTYSSIDFTTAPALGRQ